MVSPEAFDVVYAINPHMRDEAGALRAPDRAKAAAQWDELRRAYKAIGFPVDVIRGEPGLPDMVFAANQSFPFLRADGRRAALMSRMRHPERAAEVPAFEAWYRSRGYEIVPLPDDVGPFEGGGDLLRAPARRFLFGGFGFRTSRAALDAAARLVDEPVVALELVDPRFYHLDTALVPLDGTRALAVREAFAPASLRALEAAVPELLFLPPAEAAEKFAGNAHCPDGRNVLIEAECTETRRLLQDSGFRVRPIETSEFRKAGGSVYCLKTALD